jgi:hypothetical protein
MNEELKIKNHYDYLLKVNSFLKSIFKSQITNATLEEYTVNSF